MFTRTWHAWRLFFSAPEPKAHVHYCDHALSVVRRPSVRRPSLVNFSHFRLLLWNHWTELNETWQNARTQHPLPSLCFSGRSDKQDGRPGLWLVKTFLTSPLKPLKGIQRNLTGIKISKSSTKFVFFGTIRKQDGRPSLWLAETFLTSSLKPLKGIQRNLTGSKISTSSTKFVFFWPMSKQLCLLWPIPQKGGTLYSGARYVALWASCNCDVIKICGQLWSQEQPSMKFWASFPRIDGIQQAKQICKLTIRIGLACWNWKI